MDFGQLMQMFGNAMQQSSGGEQGGMPGYQDFGQAGFQQPRPAGMRIDQILGPSRLQALLMQQPQFMGGGNFLGQLSGGVRG